MTDRTDQEQLAELARHMKVNVRFSWASRKRNEPSIFLYEIGRHDHQQLAEFFSPADAVRWLQAGRREDADDPK